LKNKFLLRHLPSIQLHFGSNGISALSSEFGYDLLVDQGL